MSSTRGAIRVHSRSFAAALLFALSASAADAPRIVFTKVFPKSSPEYVAISIAKDGASDYRESPDEEPLKFQLTAKETEEIFALAEKLNRFKRQLESNLKVANTGMKTFRYEAGNEKNEVKFNYSLDPDAKTLWDWFERIAETERHFINLQRTARFDKLGVNDSLLQLEISYDRARLVAPGQFLAVLDRIAKNEAYLHMARERAAKLAEAFRGEAPKQ